MLIDRVTTFVRRRPKSATAALVLLALLTATAWVRLGPIAGYLLDVGGTQSTIVVDRNGVPLYEALSAEGTRSVVLSPADLPPTLIAATLAAEDHRFFSHPGVDPIAIARALKRNLADRQIVEGGSTISQQVAKLLLTRRDPARRRGWRAKVSEAVLALRLEHRFGKRKILAMYLNLASYGNRIVGAERASRAYFGCSASMLTPAQAAFLAGLPQRPTGFNPYRNRDSAGRRQRSVLKRMEALGLLSVDQAREASAEQLAFIRPETTFAAPHFVEMVLDEAAERRAPRVQTTIDAGLQGDVVGIIRSSRPVLEKHGAANIAVVVLDNASGQWLAWEGSGDYFDAARGGTINGPRTPRQPGSALKPFTYALAFEHGYTPASVLPDIPSHFPTADPGVLYTPRNYDGRYRGPMLARRALAGSENVPAVALASNLGVPSLIRFLQRVGVTTFDRNASYYGLGVTLGNAEVRLDELVAAYSVFARGGVWIAPVSVLDDAVGRNFSSAATSDTRERRRLVSHRTAFWIGDILSDHEAREFIFGRGGSLEFPFPVAVKTGTSQAYHDNWTIGYTRAVTVGVWVGNFDRKPLRQSSGVTGAAPIFHAVMLAAEKRFGGRTEVLLDADTTLVEADICALSGAAANEWCPTKQREWLAQDGDERPCSWHHLADEGLVTIWPAEYRQWAKQNAGLGSRGLGESGSRGVGGAAGWGLGIPANSGRRVLARSDEFSRPVFEISSPADGSTYLIDPTLRREFQTLPLRVVASRPGRISWSIDGRPVGSVHSDSELTWPLATGSHRFFATDEQGRRAQTTIVVK